MILVDLDKPLRETLIKGVGRKISEGESFLSGFYNEVDIIYQLNGNKILFIPVFSKNKKD